MMIRRYLLAGLFVIVLGSADIANAAKPVKVPETRFDGCGLPIRDGLDGQWYDTVKIGNQCWMAQNLNVGAMILGADNQTIADGIEKYCYGNFEENCFSEGGLYQWDEMMDYSTTEGVQGICPTGWHVPTDDEWKTLEMALGMTQVNADNPGWRDTNQGTQLKSGGGSGFQALLAGRRFTEGSFINRGASAFFWSSTESGSSAWHRDLNAIEARVYRSTLNKASGFSVRCVKD